VASKLIAQSPASGKYISPCFEVMLGGGLDVVVEFEVDEAGFAV
jgi:hypothetical protein